MLSDAAFASVLISSYRAKLLLPQLEPPVNSTSQVNRNAAARADAQQQQNADARQLSNNASKRAESQRLTAVASLERAAAQQAMVRSAVASSAIPISDALPPQDRVTISKVSAITKETLVNTALSSKNEVFAPASKVRVAASEPLKSYSLRDVAVARGAAAVAAAPVTPIFVAVTSPSTVSRSNIATQQYQRNEALSSVSSQPSGAEVSLGVNVHA